jgi:hypothetical protein
MKNFSLTLLTVFCALSLGFTVGRGTKSSSSQAVVSNNGAPPAVQILSPRPGATLQQNGVQVRYQVQPAQNATVPPSINFLVRLDGRDPVRTQENETSFAGLAPGKHTVTVELVDANGVAIAGSKTQVEFSILAQGTTQPGGGTTAPGQSPAQNPPQTNTPPPASRAHRPSARVLRASLGGERPGPQFRRVFNSGVDDPILAGAPDPTEETVPLFSCIGAGVVLGGLASARITRRRR